jgi:tRNA pseudouridine32 synthase / 23S rRNA pseudouridine746 synthase
MRTFNINVKKYSSEKIKLGDLLHQITKFDIKLVQDAAAKGAVWHQQAGKGKILRLRSINALIDPADIITFYYDQKILSFPELSQAECLFENEHYGIWHKPAGIMPQGTQYSDHTSLLRYIEKRKKKDVYLIHRLDRETEGLMILGYSSMAAGKLSELFQKNKITKTYLAIVKGDLPVGESGEINESLDDKKALTFYRVLSNKEGQSLLELVIATGRFHQIRRHLEFKGYPVMGDPKYGKGNKNRDGLKLMAKAISFQDPWSKQKVEFSLDKSLII